MTEPAAPDASTVGAALRAARELAGLSVDDVSARTRIRGALIRDLEADRFTSSGAPVYARGHVRAIARAVGADADLFLRRFDDQSGRVGDRPPVVSPAPVGFGPRHGGTSLHVPVAARPERRGPNWVAAGSAALGVLVLLFAIGTLTGRAPRGGDRSGAEGPAATPSTQPAPIATKALTAARPPSVGADLRVRVIGGDSWVSVRNSVTTLFEGVLHDGGVKDFKDVKQLRLIVGNAGAVSLVCGGRDLGPAGGPGMVLRFTCNADGIGPA